MITAATMRRIRQQVCKNELPTIGFEGRRAAFGPLFVRVQGEQIQGIHFQASQFGGEYVVNLGLHYLEIPSPVLFEIMAPELLDITNFLFRTRVGTDLGKGGDWFAYGESTGECRSILSGAIRSAVETIECGFAAWSNPDVFLTLLAPEDITELCEVGVRSNDEASGSVRMLRAYSKMRPWMADRFALCLFLCILARRAGRRALALRFADVGLELPGYRDFQKAALHRIRAGVL